MWWNLTVINHLLVSLRLFLVLLLCIYAIWQDGPKLRKETRWVRPDRAHLGFPAIYVLPLNPFISLLKLLHSLILQQTIHSRLPEARISFVVEFPIVQEKIQLSINNGQDK